MAMLEFAKKLLRVSDATAAFNDEITDLIESARSDLKLAGVLETKVMDDTDSLIRRAVSIYVKAEYGWDNPDAERLRESYRMLKMHLTLSQEYTVAEVVE
jgi:hypothetical protein